MNHETEKLVESITAELPSHEAKRRGLALALAVVTDRWLHLLRRPTDTSVPLSIAIARTHALDLGATAYELDGALRNAQSIRAREELLS